MVLISGMAGVAGRLSTSSMRCCFGPTRQAAFLPRNGFHEQSRGVMRSRGSGGESRWEVGSGKWVEGSGAGGGSGSGISLTDGNVKGDMMALMGNCELPSTNDRSAGAIRG